jgi:peptidoglycan/LPS O-acetylase OafA/YrhL
MQIRNAVSFITRNVRRIFPTALVACGLGLTAAWMLYLGYGILQLLDLVV